MSFSGNIKEELAGHHAKARHCNLAELSALVEMAGAFRETESGVCRLAIHTEYKNGYCRSQEYGKRQQQLSYLRQRRRAFGCQAGNRAGCVL